MTDRQPWGTASLYLDRNSHRWRIICRDGTTVYYYRAVMEAELRRPLLSTEHVHHVNGDTEDDRAENLALLDGRAHGSLHAPAAVASRLAKYRFAWSKDHPECTECGTSDRPYFANGHCQRCYHRIYMRARRAVAA